MDRRARRAARGRSQRPPGLGQPPDRAQAAAAIDLVLHVVRDGPTRRLGSIAAVLRRPGGPVVVPALDWSGGEAVPVPGPAWPTLRARLGLLDHPEFADLAGSVDLAHDGDGDG